MKIDFSSMDTSGILYVLVIKLEGKELVKVGITSCSIEDRVCGILRSIFTEYRIFPEISPRKFKKVCDYRSKERVLHEYLKEHQYTTKHKWGGYTEVFDVSIDKVVAAYEHLIAEGSLYGYTDTVL